MNNSLHYSIQLRRRRRQRW